MEFDATEREYEALQTLRTDDDEDRTWQSSDTEVQALISTLEHWLHYLTIVSMED